MHEITILTTCGAIRKYQVKDYSYLNKTQSKADGEVVYCRELVVVHENGTEIKFYLGVNDTIIVE